MRRRKQQKTQGTNLRFQPWGYYLVCQAECAFLGQALFLAAFSSLQNGKTMSRNKLDAGSWKKEEKVAQLDPRWIDQSSPEMDVNLKKFSRGRFFASRACAVSYVHCLLAVRLSISCWKSHVRYTGISYIELITASQLLSYKPHVEAHYCCDTIHLFIFASYMMTYPWSYDDYVLEVLIPRNQVLAFTQ